MNRIRFTHNRQNVCCFGGIILVGNRAWPAVPGSQASKNWNGLSNMSELFTANVHGQFPVLSGVNNRRPTFQLPQKIYICVAKRDDIGLN